MKNWIILLIWFCKVISYPDSLAAYILLGEEKMQKIKTLSNVYLRPEPIMSGTPLYLQLHILSTQMERLHDTRENCLNKIELVDKKMEMLKKRYNELKNLID